MFLFCQFETSLSMIVTVCPVSELTQLCLQSPVLSLHTLHKPQCTRNKLTTHRTNLSAQGTDLTAHCTNPTVHKKSLSAHCTNPSAHRTNLSAQGTDLSVFTFQLSAA